MVAVESIPGFVARGKAGGGIMHSRQRHPVCSRVGQRASRPRRASPRMTKQHGGTLTFRQRSEREQRAITRRIRGGDGNTLVIEVGEKPGFGCDVGLTASAPL